MYKSNAALLAGLAVLAASAATLVLRRRKARITR